MCSFSRCVCSCRRAVRSPALWPGRAMPAKCSLSSPERKSPESWGGIQRRTEEQGTLLALRSRTPTSNALTETPNKPPKIGTKTNTETSQSIPVTLLSTICIGQRREIWKG